MSTYYLRVEAVNLGSFIFDTSDLSTIRGGSLTLIEVVEWLNRKDARDKLKLPDDFRALSTGASIGLFQFEAPSVGVAEDIAKRVRGFLADDPAAKHATFVVDVSESSGGVTAGACASSRDREMVLAMNRWRQMRQPSLAIPTWNTDTHRDDGERVTDCEIDRIRPGTELAYLPDEKPAWVSPSVLARLVEGRFARQSDLRSTDEREDAATGFYWREIGLNETFTQDFGSLSKSDESTDEVGRLDAKMAVIYIDGNGFGSRQTMLEGHEQLTSWDRAIKARRRAVLQGLLDRAASEPSWRYHDPKVPNGRIRFETLLWGGDDVMWVVPAWKGWDVLAHFFSAREWEQPVTADDGKQLVERLTHAAGLVFCHHNAPIHRITKLAHDLAEKAKQRNRELNVDEDAYAYAVLESFDHIGEGIDRYWDRRSPERLGLDDEGRKGSRRSWVLPGASMGPIAEVVRDLKQDFPRRKLYQIVREWLESPERARATIDATWRRLDDEGVPAGLRESFEAAFPTDLRWVHLAELWDYIL